MNATLQAFARQTIKNGLKKCNSHEQLVFKRMYANGNLETPIDKVVDNMAAEKLDWAMEQVARTIGKNHE